MGKVDFPENACVVRGKTDEVLDDGTTHFSAEARGVTLGEDLIRHGFAVPPSPPGEGFWLTQQPDKSEFVYKLEISENDTQGVIYGIMSIAYHFIYQPE